MKRFRLDLALVLAPVLGLSIAACAPAYGEDFQLQRMLRNQRKVKSFSGRLVEEGVVAGKAVKTDVSFARPNHFAASVVEPAAWSGTSVSYDGSTLVYHYPQLRYAVRFSNLSLPAGKEAEQVVEYQYRHDIRSYDYELSGSSKVADYPTITLRHRARQKDAVDRRGWTKVHDPYSFPLAGELVFTGDNKYSYAYETLRFNEDLDKKIFVPQLPAGTLVAEWDLNAPAVSDADGRAAADFELRFPDSDGASFELTRTRIVRAAGPLPAFCARYDRGPHFLLVIEHHARGQSVPDYGLAIDAGGPGRLILGPGINAYSFVRGETYHTLLGNLPLDELLSAATKLRAGRDAPRF